MIFIDGEPYARYNLPGLPLLPPALGLFFCIGLLVTLANALGLGAARRATALARASEWLLLAWLPAMLLPTAIAIHDIFPNFARYFRKI